MAVRLHAPAAPHSTGCRGSHGGSAVPRQVHLRRGNSALDSRATPAHPLFLFQSSRSSCRCHVCIPVVSRNHAIQSHTRHGLSVQVGQPVRAAHGEITAIAARSSTACPLRFLALQCASAGAGQIEITRMRPGQISRTPLRAVDPAHEHRARTLFKYRQEIPRLTCRFARSSPRLGARAFAQLAHTPPPRPTASPMHPRTAHRPVSIQRQSG